MVRIYFEIGARKRKSPVIAIAIPSNLTSETGSLKKKIPARAIIAAPPARIIGTEERGPPFWNRRKKKMVPTPTQMPVNIEYQTPGMVEV